MKEHFGAIFYMMAGQGIKYFGSRKLAKAYGLKAWCCGEVFAWRVMVAAAIKPVAFAYMVGKRLPGFGINVPFKGVAAMPAKRAYGSAGPAVVGFEGIAVGVGHWSLSHWSFAAQL